MKKFTLMAALLSTMVAVSSCGNAPKSVDNPFFTEWATPFGMPPFAEIKPEHIIPAMEEGMRLENLEIDSIIQSTEEPTFDNVIVAYTQTGEFLDRVSSVYGTLTSSMMNDELRKIQETLSPMLTKHGNAITLNDELFAKVKSVYDRRDSLGLDSMQLRLVDKVYKNFEMNGAALPSDKKAQLKEINQELSALSLRFGNNLLQEMNNFTMVIEDSSELASLPEGVIEAAAAEAKSIGKEGKWVFTLNKPSMLPFLQYAKSSARRKELYDGYLNRCNLGNSFDNKTTIDSIANIRQKRAALLGYKSHADFTLQRNMAANPANVYALLNELWTPALERAKNELAEMKAIKERDGEGTDFLPSDWWYYAEKLRTEKYALDESMISPYFSLDNVRNGIFTVVGKLYGITFKEVKDAPMYSEECSLFEVFDNDGSHLGALLMDMHPRKGKRVGAWCSSLRSQTYKNGVRVAPISTITCNFTRPTSEAPALLSLDEVETFFHEFGHAMHGLVSDVKYNGLKGVSRDFVELPSQIMENWAMSPSVIKMYAKHYKSGEVIPDSLVTKISNSSLFNQGFSTVEYLAASLLDMDYHTLEAMQPIDVAAFESEALTKRGLMPEVAPRYRSTYFQHIFSGGYSSGYYSYIWAEVLDADAFRSFEETGDLFNAERATSFRKNVLEVGGSRDEMESYKAFRGKEPSKEPLLKNRGLI